ncbi:MAG: hypothetical protein JW737_00130 [Acidobacteria bacterium]|nr:hypothetical protein [Acidobacteriota bacterium]
MLKKITWTLILISLSAVAVMAQFDESELFKPQNPVTFKITGHEKPIKIADSILLNIKFSVEPGYHINLYPPFKIGAKIDSTTNLYKTEILIDKKVLDDAEKKVDKGETVILHTDKPYGFKILGTKNLNTGKHSIDLSVTVFFCSDTDGICLRKALEKNIELTLTK